MNSSKEFIKMCAEAEEIQQEREWFAGDWFSPKEIIDLTNIGKVYAFVGKVYAVGCDEYYLKDWSKAIWIPRQDQLLKMFKFNYLTIDCVSGIFMKCQFSMETSIRMEVDSIEIGLLKMLMYINFDKIWYGDKWVKMQR